MIDKEITNSFGITMPFTTEKIDSGLINNSYRILPQNEQNSAFFVQKINTNVFSNPAAIQQNYQIIAQSLIDSESYRLPKLIPTTDNKLFYQHTNGEIWRCMELIPNAYSKIKAQTPEEAYSVAKCFGKFSADLSKVNTKEIKTILPGFHDLSIRIAQLKESIKHGNQKRIQNSQNLLRKIEENSNLIDLCDAIKNAKEEFPLHIMHHDCKIANMLFSEKTNQLLTPIDLDTTQPGWFFSDLGDMIRSIIPSLPENAENINDLQLKEEYLQAIMQGYKEAMSAHLTKAELSLLEQSGNIIIYMQAIRFLTDYFNDDKYYQITYSEENKIRTANQLQVLDLLKAYQNVKISKYQVK